MALLNLTAEAVSYDKILDLDLGARLRTRDHCLKLRLLCFYAFRWRGGWRLRQSGGGFYRATDRAV